MPVAASTMNTPQVPLTIPPIAHAVGGSIGSTISMLLLYPLERVRIEMQAQANNIVKEEQKDEQKDESSIHDDDIHMDRIETKIAEDSSIDSIEDQKEPQSISSTKLDLQEENNVSSPVDSPLHSPMDDANSRESSLFSFEVLSVSETNEKQEIKTAIPISKETVSKTPVQQLTIPSMPSSASSSTSSSSSKTNKINTNSNSIEIYKQEESSALEKKLLNLFKKSTLLCTIHKLRLQKTLYKGSTPIALTLALSNFIFFYTLQTLKKVLNQESASFMTSTLAGIVNVLLTNPFWVVNLRRVQRSGLSDHSTWSCLKDIIETEGLSQLWAGTGASLLLVSNPAIQYYVYESCKLGLLSLKQDPQKQRGIFQNIIKLFFPSSQMLNPPAVSVLRPLEAFVIGALAKALATVATYPLQLAQVLMRLQTNAKAKLTNNKDSFKIGGSTTQIQRGGSSTVIQEKENDDGHKYEGLFDCMMKLYNKGGVRALYSGMDAKLIQTVLTSAITLLTYEQILDIVAQSYWRVKHISN